VHRVVKQIIGKNRDVVGAGCIKGSDGKVLTNAVEVKERWKAYFENLLNGEFEWDKNSLIMVDEVSGPAEIITYSGVKADNTGVKSGKAAGPSGVVAKMLKASGDVGVKCVTDLCNFIVQEGTIPDDWKKSWIVNVYKENGDALECG
jgi:hypothetical protein